MPCSYEQDVFEQYRDGPIALHLGHLSTSSSRLRQGKRSCDRRLQRQRRIRDGLKARRSERGWDRWSERSLLETLLCVQAGFGAVSSSVHACDAAAWPHGLRACFPPREQPADQEMEALKQKPMAVQANWATLAPAGGRYMPPLRVAPGLHQALGSSVTLIRTSVEAGRLDLPFNPPKGGDGVALLAKDLHPQPATHFAFHFSDRA